MRYYTSSQLSEHIRQTPEGYLVCEGVPVARTGSMRYAPDEVPDDITDGLGTDAAEVLVYRKAAEVFAPATLASFEGKPLVIDHPAEDVTPDTWADLAVGHIQNVRRGDPKRGEADDLMLADIVITRADAIRAVNEGLRELSCGYDADYTRLSPGVGEQRNIIGNHVALVEHGRAGARCRINDGDGNMAKKQSWWDRVMGNPKVRQAVKDAEAEAEAKEAGQAADAESQKGESQSGESQNGDPKGSASGAATDDDMGASLEEIKLMLRTLIERSKGTEGAGGTGDEEPTGDGDPACNKEPTGDEDLDGSQSTGDEEPKATGDAARFADADTVRRAAMLAPQTRFRVGDRAVAVRRAALAIACRDNRIKRTVDAVLGGEPLSGARPASLAAAFMAASEVAAIANNRRTGDALVGTTGVAAGGASGRARNRDGGVSPDAINKMNAEFYKRG